MRAGAGAGAQPNSEGKGLRDGGRPVGPSPVDVADLSLYPSFETNKTFGCGRVRVTEDLALARKDLVAALSRQSTFWGVGKLTGALFAVLYLAEGPLTLDDLVASLGASKGNVSVAMRTLDHLGMVHRSVRPADRHVYFEAETDFWEIGRRVLSRRQKPEFDHSFDLVAQSMAHAASAPEGPEQRFVLERLEALEAFYAELDSLVELILRLDPRRLSRVLKLAERVRNVRPRLTPAKPGA